jgi:exoribonuclease II
MAITDTEILRRRDFREALTFTIDPTEAKDFDDALSFEPSDDGNYRIGIETDGASPAEAAVYHTVLGNFGRKYPFDHIIYDPREPHKMLFAAEGITAEDV